MYMFLLAASIIIIFLVLGFLDTIGIIKLSPFMAYELGAAAGTLLGITVDFVIFILVARAIGKLYNRWRTRKEKTQ